MTQPGQEEMDVFVQPTPNPNALKFVLPKVVKEEGYSNYSTPQQCGENNLAAALFALRGIDQLYFFENVITVNKFSHEEWEAIESEVIAVIKEKFPSHNPAYHDPDPEKERRANLSPDLATIETILDRTIRPGLQGDGGDIQALSYQDNILIVKYQGACGTCPSSTTGTLAAITSILRDEFNPEIDVYIAPDY